MDSGVSYPASSIVPATTSEDATENQASSKSYTPIYWQHRRYESYVSIGRTKSPPIVLEDNTLETPHVKSPLWAKAVTVDDYTIVSGSVPGVGDYITWTCKIDTLDVSDVTCTPSHPVLQLNPPG